MQKKLAILITASPLKTQSHIMAMCYIGAAHHKNIDIKSVFFYQDAVYAANKLNSPPSDEPQISDSWVSFAKELDIELQTCVAASFRRGILDEQEARESALGENNLRDGFNLVGLGQLASAMNNPDINLVHIK